jgi:hypothetical protein
MLKSSCSSLRPCGHRTYNHSHMRQKWMMNGVQYCSFKPQHCHRTVNWQMGNTWFCICVMKDLPGMVMWLMEMSWESSVFCNIVSCCCCTCSFLGPKIAGPSWRISQSGAEAFRCGHVPTWCPREGAQLHAWRSFNRVCQLCGCGCKYSFTLLTEVILYFVLNNTMKEITDVVRHR